MPDFHRSHAAVIGIDGYRHGIPPLRTAVNDAVRLAAILEEEHGYEVELLVEDVTRTRLEALFAGTLKAQVTEHDRLLVYFAGHGIALDGDDGPEGFLIPQDARPEDHSSFLPMTGLHAWLDDLPCRHLLAILDCCFAGAFRWASTRHLLPIPPLIHQERYDRFIRDPAWQVITSAAYDQKALDVLSDVGSGALFGERGECETHSPFALALHEALAGAGDLVPAGEGDGVITATELYLYLRDSVEVKAQEQARHRQTPGLWPLRKHDKGEYILLVPGHQLNLPPAPKLTYDNNPYRGLKSYDERHGPLFFGRDDEIEDLSGLVAGKALTAVLGASGTGKSSLVKAGLVPRLRNEAGDEWTILPPLRPTATPLLALHNLLAAQLGNSAAGLSPEALRTNSASLSEAVGAWHRQHPGQKLLLVVDQLEELVTLCSDDRERSQFLALLAAAVKGQPQAFRLVVTLRTDFEPQLAEDTPLAGHWAEARYVVPPMDHDDLRDVIEGPASVRVLYFQPYELVDELITEVIQTPGALPLLSFTLSELYIKYLQRQDQARRAGLVIERSLTQDDYQELGGVVGSLRNRATEEYDALPDEAHRDTMRRVMLRMVAVEGGELARRRVPRSELVYPDQAENERVADVIRRLVGARLVVEGREEVGKAYVEPGHDALVRAWDKLLVWKGEAEEYLPLQRRVAQASREWDRTEDESDRRNLLWNDDPRLPLLRQVLAPEPEGDGRLLGFLRTARQALWPSLPTPAEPTWLNSLETRFVRQSIEQRGRNLRRAVVSATAVFVALTALLILAVFLWRESDKNLQASQRNLASSLSRQAAAQAQVNLDREFDLALLLAATGSQISDTVEARSSLLEALLQHPHLATFIDAGTGPVTGLVFSPDGRTLAASSENGVIQLWDPTLGTARGEPFTVTAESAVTLAFGPDGQTLHVAAGDGSIESWDLASRQPRSQFRTEHADHAWSHLWDVVFDAGGRTAAAGGPGDSIQLWDVSAGETVGKGFPEVHPGPITSVALSPGAHLLATGSEWGNGYLWVPESGEPLSDHPVLWHDDEVDVTALAFSSDGGLLASGALDGSVLLTEVEDQRLLAALRPAHDGRVLASSLSADGQHMASSGEDGSIVLWLLDEEDSEWIELTGHSAVADSLAFSPGGQTLASGHRDGRIVLWDVGRRKPLGQQTLGADAVWGSVAIHPEGELLAAGREDGAIVLWDLAAGEAVAQWSSGYSSTVTSLAYSPDGRLLASADDQVLLTDFPPRELLVPLELPDEPGEAILIAPEGKADGADLNHDGILLWDTATGQVERNLQGAGGVTGLAFSPQVPDDAQSYVLASGSAVGTVMVWDLSTGQSRRGEVGRLLESMNPYGWSTIGQLRVAFSPNGRQVASAFSTSKIGIVNMWEPTEQELAPKTLAATPIQPIGKTVGETYIDARGLAFNPADQMLAAGSFDGANALWDWLTAEKRTLDTFDLDDHTWSLAFSADGRTLAWGGGRTLPWGGADGRIVLRDVKARRPLGEPLTTHGGAATDLVFSPDGRWLAALTDDGRIVLWEFSLKAWQTLACDIAGRNLTQAEWDQVFQGQEYRQTCPDLPVHPTVTAAQEGEQY